MVTETGKTADSTVARTEVEEGIVLWEGGRTWEVVEGGEGRVRVLYAFGNMILSIVLNVHLSFRCTYFLS